MAREKRTLPAAVVGGAKERHRRALRSQYDPKAPVPQGLVAKPAIPKIKHHSYFEFVENKEKKKKLEFQVTTAKSPPPGFEFVPIGDPLLTSECKELSREQDAMIFIVSNQKHNHFDETQLNHQVHRIGHHIRQTIADQARAKLGQTRHYTMQTTSNIPEPIPKSQVEYDAQVDAAIRDLFPRIPNTDRQQIIEHAFRKRPNGEKPVGLSEDITLARRVQLAVLAHIRHVHTRYDTLLRETSWNNARKVVEALCLDTLVKWRGDEETGRDQLDEILREVVVISDSEDEMSEDETDTSSIEEIVPAPKATTPNRTAGSLPPLGQTRPGELRSPRATLNQTGPAQARPKGNIKKTKGKRAAAKKDKKEKRGFKRYNAWQEAIRRNREEQEEPQDGPSAPRPDHPSEMHHLPPRAALPQTRMDLDFHDDFRMVSEGAGPAPNENGYVRQTQVSRIHPPLDSGLQPYHIPVHQPVADKVMSPAYRLSPAVSSPRRPGDLTTKPLQDMLVRSIEPASPNNAMKPAFVRAVPPRGQGFGNYSPIRSSMQFSPRTLSPLRGPVLREEPSLSSRRVGEYFPSDTPTSGGYRDERGLETSSIPRERNHLPPLEPYSAPITPIYHPSTRPQEPSHVSLISPARPLYRDDARPGDRSNPILMEDRGGFYERVPSRPEAVRTFSGSVEVRRVVSGRQRPPEPHRIVSSDEGSRILRESQGRAGVQVIPIARGQPLPPDARPHFVPASTHVRHGSLDGVVRVRDLDSERPPLYAHRNTPEARPVSRRPMTPVYGPNGEVRYMERPPPPQFNEPVQRYYPEEPLDNGNQYDPRRRYPLRSHRPEDVIVLD